MYVCYLYKFRINSKKMGGISGDESRNDSLPENSEGEKGNLSKK